MIDIYIHTSQRCDWSEGVDSCPRTAALTTMQVYIIIQYNIDVNKCACSDGFL